MRTRWQTGAGAVAVAATTALLIIGAAGSPAAAGTWGKTAHTTSHTKHAASHGKHAASHGKHAASGTKPAVHVANVTGVGKVLVDGGGETVYVFSPDKHSKPTCSGACAAAWPPVLLSKKPTAGAGARKALLGTVRRSNGKLQATYDHWPLYTFVGDSGPGQARGNGLEAFGGKWSIIDASGKAFATTAAKHPTTTTTTSGSGSGGGSSGGYGY